ncbi:hypothetical protein HAX54_032586, partial [Datura stramonium]|nr:hypothetical protein [Datura stramonium]
MLVFSQKTDDLIHRLPSNDKVVEQSKETRSIRLFKDSRSAWRPRPSRHSVSPSGVGSTSWSALVYYFRL